MKWLAVVLFAVLLPMQYRLWLSSDGAPEVLRLRDAVAARKAENAQLAERNRQLAAEVRDLKQGYSALEERARSDLGMIAGNESFYQVIAPRVTAPAMTPSAPAPVSPNAQRTAAAR
ncbi:MAG TPA: cell division protein FtsB [Steroidobacteraceae bacterium]|jgi:cell division protein FtsB